MRLPYIQVTQETWDYAKQLAELTGVGAGVAFLAVCDLWRWGLALGPDDVAPSGICDSPRAATLLAAALSWRGDPQQLAADLLDLGLLEARPNGLRVRGMGRYKRTWEKNRRKPNGVPVSGTNPARVVPETGTFPAPPAPEPARQTQTQTQTQTQIEERSIAGLPPLIVQADPLVDAVLNDPPARPPRERKARPIELADARPANAEGWKELVADMFEAFKAATGDEYHARDADFPALKALRIHGDEAIRSRWRKGLAATDWLHTATLAQLRTKWNDLANHKPIGKLRGDEPAREYIDGNAGFMAGVGK